MSADVYQVPESIDNEVARLKLDAMGVKLEVETKEQEQYRRKDLLE